MTERYNGWTNYETWNAALWIGNEEGSQAHFAERAQACFDDTDEDDDPDTRADEATNALAKEMEAWCDDTQDELGLPSSGMFADLLGTALQRIDWHEIARHYVDDVDKPAPATDGAEAEA